MSSKKRKKEKKQMIWALGLISLKCVFGNLPSLDGSQEMWGTSAQEFNQSFKKLRLAIYIYRKINRMDKHE